MKKFVMSLFFTLLLLTSGCGSESPCDCDTFIIAGLHNNSPIIHFENVKAHIDFSTYNGGRITLCDSTSDSKILSSVEIPVPGNYAKEKIAEIADNYTNQIIGLFKTKVDANKTNEVDVIKALDLAARSTYGKKANIIVMDPGLSTSGILNFTQGWLYSEESPEEIANEIKEYIPDLSGRHLSWYYLGDVKAPQPALTKKEKIRLQDIWTQILMISGADFTFLQDIPSAEAYTDLGFVSIVSTNQEEIPAPTPQIIKVLPETAVRFKGDSAELIDETKAVDECKELEDYLANTDARILITGCTASGNREFCLQLSLERAKTIKDILVSLGIEENRIEIEGVGYDLKYCENDRDVSGKQIEDIASKNRKVIVTEVP